MKPLILNNLFGLAPDAFERAALELFRYQYAENVVYQNFCDALGKKQDSVHAISDIPFLPIRFFKTHQVVTGNAPIEICFESSGTTGQELSKHYVQDLDLYAQSFRRGFQEFYGNPSDWAMLALLPSYLERGRSSLVYMVQDLMAQSGHAANAFFLHDHGALASTLEQLEKQGQQTLLIGVTYALLDFAAAYPMPLKHTIVMETGGMKGRREELLREEVHALLKNAFQLEQIHSEYGMTELLSQAYSKGAGVFQTPAWMKVLVRDEDDPATCKDLGRGALNIIDLANVYSCAFIATDDVAEIQPDGRFRLLGRLDQSDIRGCSLMVV